MKRLAIIGSGDLGKQIAHLAQETKTYEVAGFFDDFKPAGTDERGALVLGNIDDVLKIYERRIFDFLFVAVGYQHRTFRKACFERFSPQIPFGKIIHPSCNVDSSASIGDGTVLYSGCTLDQHVQVGSNCILYNGCIVAHDSIIQGHSILSPGVKIAGFCRVGENNHLGIGTVISDNITLIDDVRTGAGSVIVKPIQVSGLYVGIPAKLIQ
jgi:sugar O-acyltransferase (sialic acid O-acetyltransferase NeuD family)